MWSRARRKNLLTLSALAIFMAAWPQHQHHCDWQFLLLCDCDSCMPKTLIHCSQHSDSEHKSAWNKWTEWVTDRRTPKSPIALSFRITAKARILRCRHRHWYPRRHYRGMSMSLFFFRTGFQTERCSLHCILMLRYYWWVTNVFAWSYFYVCDITSNKLINILLLHYNLASKHFKHFSF